MRELTVGTSAHYVNKGGFRIFKCEPSSMNKFFADGVMAASIMIGSIFSSGEQLFRVNELMAGTVRTA